jgi:hypothetical protein
MLRVRKTKVARTFSHPVHCPLRERAAVDVDIVAQDGRFSDVSKVSCKQASIAESIGGNGPADFSLTRYVLSAGTSRTAAASADHRPRTASKVGIVRRAGEDMAKSAAD